mmetsp:Transcript_21765/g.33826  ORF Transcript_21765/g.33826 Transcript_21765/m.33826 type:complete len:237 (-) Transcript_21765:24-734(-)
MLRRASVRFTSARTLVGPCPVKDESFALGEKSLPYYVAPVPRHKYAFLEHDKVSDGYNQGFRPKNIHWLYRWRHNLNPMCTAVGLNNHTNPYAIQVHWLENKVSTKLAVAMMNDEGYPHLILWITIVMFTTWHITRYIFFHPEITLWYLDPLKNAEYMRFNKLHPMDAPVFRWFQGSNEFYGCNHYQAFVRAGAVVNDPWVEKCKEDGTFDELLKYPGELKGRIWPPKKEAKKAHH